MSIQNFKMSGLAPIQPVERTIENSKQRELKKVFTYNIICNQPTSKMLPSKARLPYRYAIPFELDKVNQSMKLSEADGQHVL